MDNIITLEQVVEMVTVLKMVKPGDPRYEEAQFYLKVEATNYNLENCKKFIKNNFI